MTDKRRTDPRDRELEATERIAQKLIKASRGKFRPGEIQPNNPDAKTWWIVAQAATEIISALKKARKAAGTGSVQTEGKEPPIARDHDGVPVVGQA